MGDIILSRADAQVLASVFDPESAISQQSIRIEPSLPQDPHITSEAVLALIREREGQAIRLIEEHESAGAGVKDEIYRRALIILDELILQHPDYASARNNRAQLRRWRYGDRHALCQPRTSPDSQRLAAALASLDDLSICIELASPKRRQDPISVGQCKLLGQAHTQLAALYHGASKDLAEGQDITVLAPDLAGFNKVRIDELASHHFHLGGVHGNEVARALAVHTNANAKLCGSIVQEAIRREMFSEI